MYGVAWLLGLSTDTIACSSVAGWTRPHLEPCWPRLVPPLLASTGRVTIRLLHALLTCCSSNICICTNIFLYVNVTPTGASSACWSHQSYNALQAQIKTINNQNRDEIKTFSVCHEISAQLRMCSVHCPQDLLMLSAKIETMKNRETCKIWPISASAQLLRAASRVEGSSLHYEATNI